MRPQEPTASIFQKNCQTAKVLVIRAAIGVSEVSFRYMPLNGGRSSISHLNSTSTIFSRNGLTTAAAVVDTIKGHAILFRLTGTP